MRIFSTSSPPSNTRASPPTDSSPEIPTPKKHAYLDELRGMVRTLGIADDITFLGHRPDIREIMAVSDIVCALSQQPESFGRTVLEAMALGKPVVGYDCGGVGELLASHFPAGRVPLGERAACSKSRGRSSAASHARWRWEHR